LLLQGKTTGVNIMKGVLVQVGATWEEARARVPVPAGSVLISDLGWPLLMPTLDPLGGDEFVSAAGATSSIILLASRDTMTLSLMALELSSVAVSNRKRQASSASHRCFHDDRSTTCRYLAALRVAPRHALLPKTAPATSARVPN